MKKISHCRACGSKALSRAFAVPRLTARDGLRDAASGGRKRSETEFVFCDPARDANACGLLQAADASPAPLRDAPSSRYASRRGHLRTVATEALEAISGRDCAALDIGCNDGTLLSFYPRWVERFGIDPSARIDDIGAWARKTKAAFPSAEADLAFAGRKFDIVTAASVLESIDEPRAFFAKVKALLAPDGVFAIETLYAPMMLTRTNVEAFAGGAVCVYSLGVLERLVRDCDLKIFRGALTDKEGGSIRLYVTHAGAQEHDFDPWFERLGRLWDEENALALRAAQPYQAFERRADAVRNSFRALLAEIAGQGDRAHLCGDPQDCAALMALAGDERRAIAAIVGDAAGMARPQAFGLPLVTEAQSRGAEPDFLIAPASLKREMLERFRDQILLGLRIVFASPEPHIVHVGNYASELGKTLAGSDGAGGVETLRAILGAAGGPHLVSDRSAPKTASA